MIMRYPIDKNIVKATIKRRSPDSDKSTVGSLLSVCGSYGMAGAAIMSSKAALRSGIGLLKLCVPRSIYPIMSGAVPEAVFYPVEDVAVGDTEAVVMLNDTITPVDESDSGSGST